MYKLYWLAHLAEKASDELSSPLPVHEMAHKQFGDVLLARVNTKEYFPGSS